MVGSDEAPPESDQSRNVILRSGAQLGATDLKDKKQKSLFFKTMALTRRRPSQILTYLRICDRTLFLSGRLYKLRLNFKRLMLPVLVNLEIAFR